MTQAVRSREDSRARLNLRRTLCYIVLAVICFLCLFFFYVLVINATSPMQRPPARMMPL